MANGRAAVLDGVALAQPKANEDKTPVRAAAELQQVDALKKKEQEQVVVEIEENETTSTTTTSTTSTSTQTSTTTKKALPKLEQPPLIDISSVNPKAHPFFKPFPWTIFSSQICPTGVQTLFVVHTAIHNRLRRDAIRATYANKFWYEAYGYRTLFAVGHHKEAIEEERIREEAAEYRDIIQADFMDAYRNMTIKYLMWMRFVRDHCKEVKLIVKMDDDILPNIFWIFMDLKLGKIHTNRTFTGVNFAGPVFRDIGSPWYVAKEAHPEDNWESYCSGPAFFQSADMTTDLVKQAEQHEHYVSVDDAWVTGTLAKEIGAHHDFTTYASNFQWNDKTTEMDMLARTHIFGAYKTTTAAKRIFNELRFMYGMATDPPDHFKGFYKGGPQGKE
ncbi:unnamed protein product, partial [Mesorhabditis belari]|uniref:Hexosyltransferase n=1 Tax=Mesorhabditis belari TaxID=2138241 RepID=A0AAF3EVL8_9BILA